jgi:hypothetical protein
MNGVNLQPFHKIQLDDQWRKEGGKLWKKGKVKKEGNFGEEKEIWEFVVSDNTSGESYF